MVSSYTALEILPTDQCSYQTIDTAIIIVRNIRNLDTTYGFFILYPFLDAFALASDAIIVWTIFGVIRSRLQALHGETRSVKSLRIAAIVATLLLAALAIVWEGIYIRYIVHYMNSDYAPYSIYYDFDAELLIVQLVDVFHGINVARRVLELLLSFLFIGLAVKLFLDNRSKGTRSKVSHFPSLPSANIP